MFEKIRQIFNYWASAVAQFGNEGRYFLAILTFLPPTILVGLLIGLVIKAIMAGVSFLFRHSAQLFFAAFAICVFVAWLDKRKADKIERRRKEQEIQNNQNYLDRLEAAQTQDATYTAGAKVLFPVSRDLGPLGIVPSTKLSDLYSPGRTVVKANGTVSFNVYLLQIDRETVDTDLVKHTLQIKIDQRLQAGEFPGIPEQYIYRTRVYSGFVVDMVRNSTGGFIEVYTAFVDDSYCRYHENRELNKYRLLPPVDRRDTDY